MLAHMAIMHEQSIGIFFQLFRFGMTGKAPVFGNFSVALNHMYMALATFDTSS
jgi:hypothetical protein